MYFTNFIIASDGSLYGCGMNNYGQLGIGSKQSNPIGLWQKITEHKWLKVCSHRSHTLAIRSDGTLWAWGNNDYGQLGTGDYNERLVPTQIGTDKWIDISVGDTHSAGIKDDGSLYTWGGNAYGQLGLGDNSNRNSPTLVSSYLKIKKVSCGFYHTLIVSVGIGDLLGAGRNDTYQLGQNNTNNYNSFALMSTSVVDCSAGYYHSVFIKKDGSLYGCGSRMYGELMLNPTPNFATTATLLDTDKKWKKIFCGDRITIGLRVFYDDYVILVWFGNGIGNSPVTISDYCHYFWGLINGVCVIDYDGKLKGIGQGYYLGLNNTNYYSSLVDCGVSPIKTRIGYKHDWSWEYFVNFKNYQVGNNNNWVWGSSGSLFVLKNNKEFKVC